MKHIPSILAATTALAHGLIAQQPQPAPAPTPKPSPVREVIVIIKTHFDIGYTHRV